jgi:surfactin synthase thioesterase subunit
VSSPWLLREPDPTASLRLFCLPISGLGASTFRRWPTRIGAVEVCPVQLPGRENRMRERPCTDMLALARDAADALEPALDLPYAFFGHCLGGRIGYALATELLSRGAQPPVALVASSCLAPHHGGRFGPYRPEMTDAEYVETLQEGARRQGLATPDPELAALAVRLLRADVELSCGYQPSGPTEHPLEVTTVGWTADRDVAPHAMSDWTAYGPVHHQVLAGDELGFLSAPPALLHLLESLASRPSSTTPSPPVRDLALTGPTRSW